MRLTTHDRHFGLDLTDMLLRRRTRIVVIFALFVLGALAFNAIHGPAYTASVRVLVTPNGGTIPSVGADGTATLVVTDHGQTARNQAELLNDHGLTGRLLPATLQADLDSQSTLRDRVARALGDRWRALAVRLGLISPATPQERFAARLSRAVSAQAVGDTDVIKLDFTWDDRFFAAHAVNLLLAGYQHAIAGAAEARDALRQAQLAQADVEAELNTSDLHRAAQGGLDNVQAAELSQQKSELRTRMDTLRASADAQRLERELARRKLDDVEQAYKSGGWVDGAEAAGGGTKLADDFASLLKERQDLMSVVVPDKRALRRVDAEISEARQQNYLTVRGLANVRLGDVSDHLRRTEAELNEDEATMRSLDARAAQADILLGARAAIAARVATARRRTEAASARVDAIWQEVGGSRALSEAVPPSEPDWPQPALVLNVSVLLGAVAGLGSAMLAERKRRTLDRPADVARHLNLDVLARLTDMPAAQLR